MSDNLPQNTEPSFEDFSHENGITYWWASEFMAMLGYQNMQTFTKAIHRAMQACLAANIDTHDNFIKELRVTDNDSFHDYKLTRFACYMVAMNGDSKKPEVAKAQAYFADQADKIQLMLAGAYDMERYLIREEVKEGTKALMSAASKSGVKNFGLFHDAGYRGMYNKSLTAVKKMKGVVNSANLMDFMGRTELAANLFRITQTEENLRMKNISNEAAANQVHQKIGAQVRQMVIQNTGVAPENLKAEKKITEVTKQLKQANKQLNKKKKK